MQKVLSDFLRTILRQPGPVQALWRLVYLSVSSLRNLDTEVNVNYDRARPLYDAIILAGCFLFSICSRYIGRVTL